MVFCKVAYPYIKAVADPVYTGGVILLSMPGIFMWSKDGLPPYTVREMTGVTCRQYLIPISQIIDKYL